MVANWRSYVVGAPASIGSNLCPAETLSLCHSDRGKRIILMFIGEHCTMLSIEDSPRKNKL
jgi:hypothetical protein